MRSSRSLLTASSILLRAYLPSFPRVLFSKLCVISAHFLVPPCVRYPRAFVGSDLTIPKREEIIRRIGEQETVFPTETEWKYSNFGLILAGEIVASVSGEPWRSMSKAAFSGYWG